MEQLSTQWPLLAAFLTLYGSSLVVIRSLYERMIDTAEAREKEAIDLAKESTRVIEQLTRRLDDFMREKGVR
jgi:hypothetical protein